MQYPGQIVINNLIRQQALGNGQVNLELRKKN